VKPGPGQIALDVRDALHAVKALEALEALADVGAIAPGWDIQAGRPGWRELRGRIEDKLQVTPAGDLDEPEPPDEEDAPRTYPPGVFVPGREFTPGGPW
jgi:hypothetical protein